MFSFHRYNFRIMLKQLAIFVLSLFVFSMQTYPQTHKAQERSNSATPPLPTVPVVRQKNDARTPQDETGTHVDADVRVVSAPEKDAYDRAAFWISVVLAAVGIGGIVAAIITIRKLERQTKATEDQARHLTTSERAWIIVNSEFPDGLSPGGQDAVSLIRWNMKNVGRTPARLIEFDAIASRAERKISFPEPPRYVGSPGPLNKLLLVPNDSFGLTWMIEGDSLTPDEVAEVKNGMNLMVITYGYVKYLDAFEKEHTTRFCQRYFVDSKTKEERFVPHTEAPNSYTNCD